MTKISTGMIYTNKNCIGCNRCISKCEVIGANVFLRENGHDIIKVDDKRCLHCGKCLTACGHDARTFTDDTDRFFDDLAAGQKIALAIDPSFYIIYPETAGNMLGLLRSKGCGKIYDVAFGGDISVWCTLKYIREHSDSKGHCDKYVAQICPSVTSFAEKYSEELRDVIIPVQTPLGALAIYTKKYLRDDSRIAFISPCLSMHDEIHSQESSAFYSVSYNHLLEHLKNIDLSDYASVESDLKPIGYGDLLCTPEGFSEYVQQISNMSCASCNFESAYDSNKKLFPFISINKNNGIHPDILAMTWCDQGCLGGPVRAKHQVSDMLVTANAMFVDTMQSSNVRTRISSHATSEEKFKIIDDAFRSLDVSDFKRELSDHYHQPYTIPEDTYEEIFTAMHKDTQESRHVDCGYCGYKRCYDMATAIAYGYNREENCINYVKKEIKLLSFTDPLTGINNGTGFMNYTSRKLRDFPDKQFDIIVYKLESFAIINQLYGADIGNKVIKFAAETLHGIVKKKHGVSARLDTSRFALCIEHTPDVFDFVQHVTDFDCRHLGVEQPVHLRVGLYITEQSEQDIAHAINYAIMAMESEAASDKSTAVIFNDELKQKIDHETLIVSQMHNAIRNHEFVPYLQPQYDHSNGNLVGAEMLCRWRKNDGTIISPREFIPVFEKNGFIRELDKVMWEHAFSCMKKWIDQGVNPVPISVNISRITLFDEHISEIIDSLQQKYDVPPDYIHFEITESAYMSSQERIVDTTAKLHQLGFEVAMDDFGSGYSSLNTLKNLPVDILKLDMGFFRGNTTKRGGCIVSTIIRMAQGLDLETVAEGVEDKVLADYLRSVGCDVIQGFLYSKPVPLADYEQLLVSAHKGMQKKLKESDLGLDPKAFFDPSCVESKMFDYYTGGACIFEYENGMITIVRSNNKYLETICMNDASFDHVRTDFLSTLSADMQRFYIGQIEKAVSSKEEVTFISKRIVSDKVDPIYIRSHIKMISSSGKCVTMYSLVENISTEKNAEEKLKKSMESLGIIMDNSPAGICLFSVSFDLKATNFEFMTLAVNKGFTDISGYSFDDMQSYSSEQLLEIISPIDRPKILAAAVRLIANTHQALTYKARCNGHEKYDKLVRLDYSGVRHGKNEWLVVCNFVKLKDL